MIPIIQTLNLTKEYGTYKAVDNLSLTINQGDIYGLIGKNGAGKTTFMKIISNLARPSSGDYKIFGYDRTNAQAQTRISALIENTGTYPSMTAYDHLLLKGKSCGIRGDKYVFDLLELLGLSNTGKKKVKDFSLGMRQRLGIAIALVGEPDILVLDEPINGLDPQGIIDIRTIIERLNKEKNMTFLISSHILDELARVATNFAIIDRGKLVANFTKEELDEQNKERIELMTDDPRKTCLVFEENGIDTYKLIDKNTFYIYKNQDRINELLTILNDSKIKILDMTVKRESLEEYYMNLLDK
ncbi:MAG: ABC transporter ATP-binding protein [Anaerococcus sp.]|nr:ABC transporter ATP-binding protein [Anaerococcus sp.]